MIEALILNSVFIIGLWTVCKEGMLLGWVRDLDIPEMLQKPLFLCPPCMASVWGTLGWLVSDVSLLMWFPYVVILAGLNAIIVNVIDFE